VLNPYANNHNISDRDYPDIRLQLQSELAAVAQPVCRPAAV